MTAIFVGIIFVVGGAWGLIRWFPDFLIVARGLFPLSLLMGGVMAVIAGIGSLQSRRSDGDKKN